MLEILRGGFYRSVIVVVMTGILLGTLATIALSGAMDKYFGDFVSGLIGDVGEYDIIVHVNAETEDVAAEELKKALDTEFPGAKVKKGVTVAGNANFLVHLPDEFKTKEGLESFPSILRELPGSNGYTVMIEPRLTIRTTAPEAREYLREEVSSIEGVKFAYVNRGNIEVILKSEEDMPAVEQEIVGLLEGMKLVQIADDTIDSMLASRELSQRLSDNLLKDLTDSQTTSEQKALKKGLRQMKNILELYPSDDSVVGKVNDLADLLDRLQSPLSEDALRGVIGNLDEQLIPVLDVLEAARVYEMMDLASTTLLELGTSQESHNLFSDEVEALQNILLRVGQHLEASGDEAGLNSSPWFEEHLNEVKQGIEVLSERAQNARQDLLRQIESVMHNDRRVDQFLNTFSEFVKGLEQLKSERGLPEEVYESSIKQLQKIIDTSTEDIQRMANSARKLRDLVPELSEDERNDLIQTIDAMLAQGDEDSKLFMLVREGVSDDEIHRVVGDVLSSDATVLISAVGLVERSVHGIVYRIIGETRSVVSALVALVITFMLLVLDHSSVMSASKTLSRLKGKEMSDRGPALYGMFVGLVVFGLIYEMSAASIPYFRPVHVCITGAILGLIVNLLSEKFSPTSEDEIAAGLSLGLSMSEVMEEIVIPAARPGLMQYLVSRKQKMPRVSQQNFGSR